MSRSKITSRPASGTSWRSLTALAMTLAITARPLTRAVSADSVAVGVIPGYSPSMVDSSTLVSPSDGSTWPM